MKKGNDAPRPDGEDARDARHASHLTHTSHLPAERGRAGQPQGAAMKKGWQRYRVTAMGWNGREARNGNHTSPHSHRTHASHRAERIGGVGKRRALL